MAIYISRNRRSDIWTNLAQQNMKYINDHQGSSGNAGNELVFRSEKYECFNAFLQEILMLGR